MLKTNKIIMLTLITDRKSFLLFSCFADCMHVTSEDGEFIYKKLPKLVKSAKHAQLIDIDLAGPSMEVCGLYFVTDPDKVVEVTVKNMDVNCDTGGLMAVIYIIIKTLETRYRKNSDR